MPPPLNAPSPYATILNYLNDREGAPLCFVGFLRHPMSPHPQLDATILNYVNDRAIERGRHYPVYPVRV